MTSKEEQFRVKIRQLLQKVRVPFVVDAVRFCRGGAARARRRAPLRMFLPAVFRARWLHGVVVDPHWCDVFCALPPAQTDDHDKDERFMAVSDVITQLESFESKVDAATQVSIRDAVIKLMDDKSPDVQTNAISCLSILVKKFEDARVLEIVEKIGRNLVEGNAELRDIYATGINTIVSALPSPKDLGAAVAKCLVGQCSQVSAKKLDADALLRLQLVLFPRVMGLCDC